MGWNHHRRSAGSGRIISVDHLSSNTELKKKKEGLPAAIPKRTTIRTGVDKNPPIIKAIKYLTVLQWPGCKFIGLWVHEIGTILKEK